MHLCECLQRWRWPEPPSLIVSPNCVAMFDPAGHWGGDIHLTIRQLHCGVHFFTVVPSFAPSLVQQHHHWRQVSSFFGGIYFDVCQFQCNYIFCIIVFPQVAPFPCNNGIFKVSHTTHFLLTLRCPTNGNHYCKCPLSCGHLFSRCNIFPQSLLSVV